MASASESGSSGNKNLITMWLLVIVLVMLGYAVFGDRGVLRILQAERQHKQLEADLATLKQEQQQLREEIDRLNNDKDYWEQLARKKLGMVREGELIYHLPTKKNNRTESHEKR